MMRRRLWSKLLREKNVRTDVLKVFTIVETEFTLFISSYFYDWKLGPFLKEFPWQKNDKKAHFIQYYYILLESLCDLSIFCNRAKWPSIRITSTYISVLYSPSIFWSNFPDISFRICSSTWFWIEKSEEFTIFRQ